MSIRITFVAESKADLYAEMGRYLGVTVATTTTTTTKPTTGPVLADTEAETAATTRARKPKATEETFDLGFGEETTPPPAAKTELADVIDAFKNYAASTNRESAAKVLKSFKVKSVRDLKPEQYENVIATLNAGT
jgi:hypothetical protein